MKIDFVTKCYDLFPSIAHYLILQAAEMGAEYLPLCTQR